MLVSDATNASIRRTTDLFSECHTEYIITIPVKMTAQGEKKNHTALLTDPWCVDRLRGRHTRRRVDSLSTLVLPFSAMAAG